MWGLLGSLLIHAGVIAFFWFTPNPPPIPDEEKIEIEIKEGRENEPAAGNNSPATSRTTRSRRRGRDARGGIPLPALRDLKARGDFGLTKFEANPLPFTHDSGAATAETPPGASGPIARGAGWSPEDWGYGGGGTAYVAHTLRFTELIIEMENILNYPYVLGRRGIQGTINTRLRFKGGGCEWKKTRVTGMQPYLKIYVLTLLKKLCGLEQIKTMGFPDGMTIDMSFAFLITDEQDVRANQNARGRITGNVLMFERTFPKGMMEYQIGPIHGLWFAPVWYLDWPWVVEHWEEWVEGKDPLADFKKDGY